MRDVVFELTSGDPVPGFLLYRKREYSVDFRPTEEIHMMPSLARGGATLLLGTMQLLVGLSDTRLLYPFGYCPRTAWREERIEAPRADTGTVTVITHPLLEAGEAVQLDETSWGPWRFDARSGWLLRSRDDLAAEAVFEIAEGAFVGLASDQLSSILLHPTVVD